MRILLSLGAVVIAMIWPARAGVLNQWTNLNSGAWEGPFWTLGLPASNHLASIENAGYKAVAVSAQTVANYPESLNISDLRVGAPPQAASTLLLNWAGTVIPLRVRESLTIGENGSVVNLHSGLIVQGQLDCFQVNGGSLVQEGGITIVTNGILQVKDGLVRLTNAWTELLDLSIGHANASTGSVIQAGGVLNSRYLNIASGEYHFLSGYLISMSYVGNRGTNAHFYQLNGTNSGRVTIGFGGWYEARYGSGTYHLLGGTLEAPDLYVGSGNGHGSFQHSGGKVVAGSVFVGGVPRWSSTGEYHLSGGELLAENLTLYDGVFFHATGSVTLTQPFMLRGDNQRDGYYTPEYTMNSGHLSSPGMQIGDFAYFTQAGGTNQVQGELSLGPCYHSSEPAIYRLTGGSLISESAVIHGSALFSTPAFHHSGGTHMVQGSLTNSGLYMLSGGSLVAEDLVLTGRLVISNRVNPPVLQMKRPLLMAGELEIHYTAPELAALRLISNSVVRLGAEARVRFAGSENQPWPTGAVLKIIGWNPSQKISFGTSAGALSHSQRASIVFLNPGGHPPGVYAATILADGTLVPTGQSPLVAWGNRQSESMPLLSNVVAIASGENQNLALLSDGSVFEWGWDWQTRSDYYRRAQFSNAVAVAASFSSGALLEDGTIHIWQMESVDSQIPPDLTNVVGFSMVGSISSALRPDGTIVTWSWFEGTNSFIGPGRFVESKGRVVLGVDGKVRAWGHPLLTNVPTNLEQVISVSASGDHALALRTDGTVVAWGNNDFGQALPPAGLSNVVAVSAGNFHSVALRRDGTVVAWGRNDLGQTQVPPGLTNVVLIAAGHNHTLAVRDSAARPEFRLTIGSGGEMWLLGNHAERYVLQSSANLSHWQFSENAVGHVGPSPLSPEARTGLKFFRALRLP